MVHQAGHDAELFRNTAQRQALQPLRHREPAGGRDDLLISSQPAFLALAGDEGAGLAS